MLEVSSAEVCTLSAWLTAPLAISSTACDTWKDACDACSEEFDSSVPEEETFVDSFEESETLLYYQRKVDPLNIGGFKATKAFVEGNNSFDDRSYIRFEV